MSSSNRRSRPRRAGRSQSSSSAAAVTSEEEQISELLSKLQALLPDDLQARNGAHRVSTSSAARVLQETCSYIRSLHQEVDSLSETLAGMLASAAVTTDQAAVIRCLLLM